MTSAVAVRSGRVATAADPLTQTLARTFDAVRYQDTTFLGAVAAKRIKFRTITEKLRRIRRRRSHNPRMRS